MSMVNSAMKQGSRSANVDGAHFQVSQQSLQYLVVGWTAPEPAGLTPAEREVVQLVCEGYANKEIAAQRNTSVNTVGNQLAAIFTKFAVGSRFELIELVARLAARQQEGS